MSITYSELVIHASYKFITQFDDSKTFYPGC
jgi:hypothetical protein